MAPSSLIRGVSKVPVFLGLFLILCLASPYEARADADGADYEALKAYSEAFFLTAPLESQRSRSKRLKPKCLKEVGEFREVRESTSTRSGAPPLALGDGGRPHV